MKEPPNGLTTEATVVRIVDGDTIEVKIERTLNIRLTDGQKPNFNIAEKDTLLGQAAISFLQQIIPEGKTIKIFIPSENPERLMDINSFNRILGEIWVDGKSLTEVLTEFGYSNRSK